jgi:deoxyribodipyrimidine photo-lyase
MARAIHWFRRDLRLSDNAALTLALEEADEVIGLFILDPKLLDKPGVSQARVAFLYSSLAALAKKLEQRGGRLVIRRGMVVPELRRALKESGTSTLYFNRDYTTYARRRDEEVERELSEAGFNVKTAKDLVLFEQDELLTTTGNFYTVYTPYKRKWLERIGQQPPRQREPKFEHLRLQSEEAKNLQSLPLPEVPEKIEGISESWFLPAGEEEGKRRLKEWAGVLENGKEPGARIEEYAANRDFPGANKTSRLSPFLRFGLISPSQCYRSAINARERTNRKEGREGADTWIGELIWRDFYYQILWNFPYVAKRAFNERYNELSWSENREHLTAWQEGRTGYPIVDAGMRQLNQSAWMHNRVRMITASFLTKDLLLNWQFGEIYFWQRLVDGDQPSNNGGWQWSASTGTDAQPYFRIFNPVSQSEKFDPTGTYIRRYIPELAHVPDKYIHAPWTMPASEQSKAGCIIGKDYPAPVVKHDEARLKALEMYKVIK